MGGYATQGNEKKARAELEKALDRERDPVARCRPTGQYVR